jgi:hypothetical protein
MATSIAGFGVKMRRIISQRRLWKIAGLLILALIVFVLANVHSFLAVTSPVVSEILVVEAWFWNRPALKEAAEEYRRGCYQYVVVVGSFESDKANFSQKPGDAELAACQLKRLGIEDSRIIVLSAPAVERHRTFSMAINFRKWMINKSPQTKAINVFTIGVHSRKSRILFEKALGSKVKVGIISGSEHAYTPAFWWSSATGLRIVSRNIAGYFYALFYSPPAESNAQRF